MNQDSFHQMYKEINQKACVFEKAQLIAQVGCSCAEPLCIAERQAIRCTSDTSRKRCLCFIKILGEKARFILKNKTSVKIEHLPFSKAIRLQVGGLTGLQQVIDTSAPEKIADVHGLILKALEHYQRIDDLPFDQILKHVSAYTMHQRKTRENK